MQYMIYWIMLTLIEFFSGWCLFIIVVVFPQICKSVKMLKLKVPSVEALPNGSTGFTISTKRHCTKFCCKDKFLGCFSHSKLRHILPACISLIQCNCFVIICNVLLLLFWLVLLETEGTSRNPPFADFTSQGSDWIYFAGT